ncbi:MAG: UPF0176 protein [Halieaceae bacterium]
MSTVVAALYKFVALPDYRKLREPLLEHCRRQGLRGTLLLAEEGINGTIAGTRAAVDSALAYLRSDPRLADFEHKESLYEDQPFLRMKVKLKREIVTMGVPQVDPNRVVGNYMSPAQWDELLADPDVTLIDTRNDYECAIGTFRGAVDPQLGSFREFPQWAAEHLDPQRDRRVAMFCTGGIRCEKASSYLLEQGFEAVYHLQGGILKYLEEVPKEESSWEGECFVFDERVAVNHQLERGSYSQCFACRHPITEAEMQSPAFQKGVSCPYCIDRQSDEQRARFAERQHQVELARERGETHIGDVQTVAHGENHGHLMKPRSLRAGSQ